ncbi:MAG: elongation factor P [Christensenellaceae bacterium]|jgi:elongation factor P|nr:elongation factor P [Christensenellaceae bacterium]
MAYLLAGEFRKGVSFEMDDTLQEIVDFQHVKPGKGAAFVRAKIRNIITGGVIERTFNPNEKFELAHIERKKMAYSYNDGDLYYFMDVETYDLVPLSKELIKDALRFIKENSTVEVELHKDSAFSITPENFVELEVTDCEPGIQGATATAGTKSATLETGYVLQVPLFINIGDLIRVDTRSGSYMSKAKG